MARKPKIILAEKYDPSAVECLRACGEVQDLAGAKESVLRQALVGAEALLIRSQVSITEALLEQAFRLRVIGRAGIGLENVDLGAAQRRGVTVVYTPQASTRSVAEHALALMLGVEHRLRVADQSVREGRFSQGRASTSYRELADCVLGIVGMGRIGSAVARVAARGFGMRVLYNDIVDVGPFDFTAECAEKDKLYRDADFVSLHVPLTDQTRGMIDRSAISRMRPMTVLINTSRGAVVDSLALVAALTEQRLAGAGLDVFEVEPLPSDHPLMLAPNVLLTPHVAAHSEPARRRMDAVVEDVVAVLEGRPPAYPASLAS